MLKMADMTAVLEKMRAEQGVHVPKAIAPRILRPDDLTIKRALKRVENAKNYMIRMKQQMDDNPDRDWYRDYYTSARSQWRKQVVKLEELQAMLIEIAEERNPRSKRDPWRAHARLIAREQRWIARQTRRLEAGEISYMLFNELREEALARVEWNRQRITK